MTKILTIFLTATLTFASVAYGMQKIEDIPWDQTHIKQLRHAGKHAVFRFFDHQSDPDNIEEWDESSIKWNYAWYPAGAGKYELAIHSQSGPDIGFLTIYLQDAPGKIRYDDFGFPSDASESWYWEEHGPDLIDVNGDGIPEVINMADIGTYAPQRTKDIPGGVWPQVYRLRNGGYIEASRDFPTFYDKTVLPIIDKAMAKARKDFKRFETSIPAPNIDPDEMRKEERRQMERTLAALTMCRDKILRVLGRDPNAGLAQAHEWMTSADPVLVDDARVVFADIGGHDADVRAAKLATDRASKNWPSKYW